ncbi:ABC transporter ATP-binding protein [Achromobacter deleyi]|uniref:ABC transporter ATP-binding protein n=1 Tax=Achromobacter deleyi TaxID=1353891 RepID=UPI00146718E5|nr:ABC transporter ATP-binding protein [Achromobacter deleyi]CAB3912091.1 Iron import ATP-binding/permease protein IrtB [Achromobacter deleyi]
MLKRFLFLLGDDAPVGRRYVWMAVAYGVLCGLTIVTVAPVLMRLLAGDWVGALPWLALLAAGAVAAWAWRRRVERAGVGVGYAVLQGVRHRIGTHVAGLPVSWFTPANTARLGHVVSHGMMEVAQLPAHVFTPVISGAVAPLVVVAALLALHWQIGLITLLALPLVAAALWLSARLGRRADQAFHDDAARASHRMVEFAQAQSVLRAFNGAEGGTRFMAQAIDRQGRSALRAIFVSTLSVVLNAWMVQAAFAAALIAAALGLLHAMQGGMDPGAAATLIVSLLLVCRYVDPLLEVAGYGEALRGARVHLDALTDILSVPPMSQPASPRQPQDASVALRGVGFRYDAAGPDVLSDVSLYVAPGSMTALVGESGSGKSTVFGLIARAFDADRGSVCVGGVDVRGMSAAGLAGHLSKVFQDAWLFQGSIADNLRVGKPDASDAELREAAREAGVDEIAARLPQGLDTPVGEGGARLSGGERQRIAIARALLKDAPILLIDEATAALDAENQAAVAGALARLRGKRTLIVIAHQLSTIAAADQIVVLADGEVVEQGAPAQLLALGGRYARFLAQRQASKGWRIAGQGQAR